MIPEPPDGPANLRTLRRVAAFLVQAMLYTLGIWVAIELLITSLQIPPYLVPHPHDVVRSLVSLSQYYAWNAAVTAAEAGLGLLIALVLGFLLGVFLRYGGVVARAITPLILASQTFPKEALAPLLLVFLGFGILPKVIIAAAVSFFPIVVNTTKGLHATPDTFERLMNIIGATPWERFWRCRLPFAAPYVLAALRVCATLSVIGAVVGEFVGSSAGLGHVIRTASADIGTDRIYAALLLLGVQGAAFYGAALWVEHVLFAKYNVVH
jgi:NitT/TauT family transport system permease protein